MSTELATLLTGLGAMVLFPVVFVGWWALVCSLLGLLGGWRGLAGRYRTEQPAPPGGPGWSTGALGFVSYRSTLVPAGAPDGLDLRVPLLFRPGHPPLRVPWADIEVVGRRGGLLGARVRLRLGAGGPVLTLTERAWEHVLRARPPAPSVLAAELPDR